MKTALVTGGTTRLGLAIAGRLRTDGWRVLTSSHRADAGADIVADLSQPSGAAGLYAAALRILGGNPPDALVNNAALLCGDDVAVEAVNLTAPVKLTMLMAGRETGIGAVVNVLDADPRAAPHLRSPRYAETKEALEAYTIKAAATFAATLRVNAVAPGSVLPPVGIHEKAGETLVRRPKPGDVADAVAFLVGAGATTGVVLPVDGGSRLLRKAMS